MKKYPNFSETERIKNVQKQLDQLRLFQELLRNQPRLNEIYHGKALEIADGLQPWMDALKLKLKE